MVLALPKELTHAQANACLAQLRQGLSSSSESVVTLDASPLLEFDSAALAVLLAFRRQCLKEGRTFAIHGLNSRLADLAALYGIDELLPLA